MVAHIRDVIIAEAVAGLRVLDQSEQQTNKSTKQNQTAGIQGAWKESDL